MSTNSPMPLYPVALRLEGRNCLVVGGGPVGARKIEALLACGAIVTVEEHQVAGGLGGAVAEVLAKGSPTPMEFVGLQGVFGESGNPKELIEKYGMGVKDIKEAVKKAVKRKRQNTENPKS